MTKLEVKWLKNGISKKQNAIGLLKIIHPTQIAKIEKRDKLNIVFAIDISGSMAGMHGKESKLQKVKNACISAIGKLDKNDRFGIVTFDGEVSVICQNSYASDKHKTNAILEIQNLKPRGSTALHAGWKKAAELVCNELSPNQLNRVLLLTDGEATDGITDPVKLSQFTETMNGHNVSTSTFGVGDNFNEDLLIQMSEKGGGNSYYMDEESDMDQIFKSEFNGMYLTYGKNVEVNIDYADVEMLSKLTDKSKNIWKLPNAVKEKEQLYLFEIKLGAQKKELNFNIIYNYVDNDKNLISIEHICTLPVISDSKLSKLEELEEVAKFKMIIEIANAKEEAIKALDQGDIQKSKSILNNMNQQIVGSVFCESLQTESTRITALSMACEEDQTKFRKFSSYDVYSTRTSRN